jgi:hypothetical protein
MANYPPFMNASGNIPRILNRLKEAKTPERFTQDFLSTELGASGGSARPFIPLAKRLGLLTPDGTPTDLYKRFRNPPESGGAMAAAIRRGYDALYKRNEYAHSLDKGKLKGLIAEATGLDSQATTLGAIASTFEALKAFADFDATENAPTPQAITDGDQSPRIIPETAGGGLRLSYTVYLNLPNTSEIAVFDAIFTSLKKNLLD